ncbi:NACHT, LRR and PYD domains-containing protein 12-like [Colossoma macropomum]|uniref:NACHT, LRR and PYD domains-containing protein 12-like n=1 Tax=Colossoma macropomum TaxID=42526 RepID=UPI001863C6CE|nr:NACHT, LRR and PYD domains-containing protein 12-like [Colossoma macropomum]
MDTPLLDTHNGPPHQSHSQVQKKGSDSPVTSCVSMKSDASKKVSLWFKDGIPLSGHSLIQAKRSDSSVPSCVSMKSDASKNYLVKFKDGDPSSGYSVLQSGTDKTEEKIVIEYGQAEEMKEEENLKFYLKNMYQCLNEVIAHQENPTLLSEIYTELYITEGDSGEVNNEHEVRQIEAASRRTAREDTPIKCNEIFKPLSEQDKPIRTVLTKGVAGIGKTVSVQKFILDWAEDKANQDVQFIFPLPFRELNLMKDQKLTLVDLLCLWFKKTKETEIFYLHKALFIFDGLDECRLDLDFQSRVSLCDVTESASVDVLLINLIKGNLLPSALIWITSRPAAADQIPSECVDRVTEVRGFTDPQKEEYFSKRISDQSLANRIISHLRKSRSLYIMCHIPVFCWISATVLERMLGEAESGEIPKTLTQMYTHFLIIQTKIIREKYTKNQKTDEEMLLKLGQLAFQQLMKGNLIFYEEDLRECGIEVEDASVYSGVCTQIFREESGLLQSKVYCFVHLSVQEHLAALYVHLTFMNQKRNVFKQSLFSKLYNLMIKEITISDVHRSAMDQALQSKNGHLDLFLRFLLGLSMESSQTLLQDLVKQTGSDTNRNSHSKEETVQYIKKKIRENPSAEKSINLFHCLNELENNSLVEEVQQYLQSGSLQICKLTPSQWSAVVFVLLTSSEQMDVFDLSKYTSSQSNSDEVLLNLLPVVAASRRAQCYNCNLKKRSCDALASVLSLESSCLRELDLYGNKLGDSGVKLLFGGLENPHCRLETLKLQCCNITDKGCFALASALKSNPSHLIELDLSENKLGDSGVKLLSAALENHLCKLETLKWWGCNITDEGCAALASALKSNPSHLKELDLSQNKLGDSGVKLLSAGLENPHCKLVKLKLHYCNVTDEGCAALASALKSNPSYLRWLELSENNLGDSGVKLLSAGLENPLCKLETLRLWDCNITDEGCAALASALKSNPSHLEVLDLSENDLGNSGVKLLDALKADEHYKLHELKVW